MDKTVNQFLMVAKNAEATVEIKNNDFADCNNMANNLVFSTTSADNTITLTNYSVGSEQPKNILAMEGSKAKLWSANDNRIWSGGAVRISANVTSSGSNNDAGQDVHITGKTLHVYYDDKISFHRNGVRYDLNFNSGGSVTWS